MPVPIMNNNNVPILKAIEKGQLRKFKKQKPRDYIGGSGLGDECERKIQYNLLAPKAKAIPEMRMVRIWGLGDKVEDYIEELLCDAGFNIHTVQPGGKQYGFEMGGGRVQGHVDGIVDAGPKIMAYPALFEAKSIKHSNFKKFVDTGVATANPTYYAQLQFYQKCMKLLNPALFVMMNKDNSELYIELVEHHPAFADSLVAKASRILEATDAGQVIPRGYTDKNNFHCKYCDFNAICWKKEEEAGTPEWA